MIEVIHLSKTYGDFLAVDQISFKAKKGQIVGLLGPNGAGKTTTMRMLTGFIPPSSGSAKIAGFDILEASLEARRHIGYLPERTPLYLDMTAQEYVTFWAKMRGLRSPSKAVNNILKRVQLYEQRRVLIRKLSKGMRQRLGLAQALVHDPSVIILDEPTIGIDPKQVIEVRETIREIGHDHTVLFSTHILSEAEQICDQIFIINHGKIVAEGSPDALREKSSQGSVIFVEIQGSDQEKLKRAFLAIPTVTTVEASNRQFHIHTNSEKDIRAEISAVIMAQQASILELRREVSSLENIFLQLVEGNTTK